MKADPVGSRQPGGSSTTKEVLKTTLSKKLAIWIVAAVLPGRDKGLLGERARLDYDATSRLPRLVFHPQAPSASKSRAAKLRNVQASASASRQTQPAPAARRR